MSDDRNFFVPPEQRPRDHAPLDISELEYLYRLVEKGEGLLHSDLTHTQAEALLRTEHAEVKKSYGNTSYVIRLIVPTEKGKTLAAIYENEKLARLTKTAKPKVKYIPPSSEE